MENLKGKILIYITLQITLLPSCPPLALGQCKLPRLKCITALQIEKYSNHRRAHIQLTLYLDSSPDIKTTQVNVTRIAIRCIQHHGIHTTQQQINLANIHVHIW